MADFENAVSQADADSLKKVASDIVNDGQHRLEESTQSLERLAIKLKKESLLKPGDDFKIKLGSRNVFSGKGNDSKDTVAVLSDSELGKVNNLLQNKPISGSLRVSVNGSQTPALHIKDGKVTRNEIQYKTQQQKKTPLESPTSPKVSVATDLKIQELQKQLAAQEVKLNELSSRIKVIEQRQVRVADPKLADWVNGLKNRFKQHLQRQKQSLVARIGESKQTLKAKINQGKQTVSAKVDESKQAASAKVRQGKQAVAQAWMNTVVHPSIEKILNKFGDDGADGSKSLSTKEYNLNRSSQGEISISRKSDGSSVTPENLNGRDQQVLTELSKKSEKINQVQSKTRKKDPQKVTRKITPKP